MDLVAVAKEFIDLYDERKKYFGHFSLGFHCCVQNYFISIAIPIANCDGS